MSGYLSTPSGLPHKPLLDRLYAVLTSSTPLIDLVPVENIGINLRKSLQYPAVEFGVEASSFDRRYRDSTRILIMVYGTESPEDTIEIADICTSLMHPEILTDVSEGVILARVTRERYVTLPQDDYGHSVSMSFRSRYIYKG